MPRLRIVLAPSAYYPHIGGIEELTRQLALTLAARGHDPLVLTNRWPPDLPREEMLGGVRVRRLTFPLPAAHPHPAIRFLTTAPPAALGVVRILRGLRPDVVHVIGAGPQSAYLGALARPLGLRLVFTAQGELTFDANNVFRRSATLRLALRRVLRNADVVTACSTHVLRELVDFGSIGSQPIVIPNGVNPDDFAATEVLQPREPYVLALGRLVPQKGFDVLIEAFRDTRLTTLRLIIGGEGPERRRLGELAQRNGIADRVRFVGAVDRQTLPHLLGGAHAFAMPSRSEPFGIALLEAMAAGVPAVATDGGGVTDFAETGVNSLLVPQGDSVSLGAALHQIHTDQALRGRLIRGGLATADALAWDSIADEYLRVYTSPAGPATDTSTDG